MKRLAEAAYLFALAFVGIAHAVIARKRYPESD